MSSGYELHQKLRTKTVRQVKKQQYDEAITTLHQGALELLQKGEQGSGCDLAVYMINVYTLKPQQVDAESRDRITDILQAAAPDFWRKKVVDAAVKWSVKSLNASTGDPLLRLFIAKLLAKEGDYHAAEQHFLAACVPTPATYTVESAPLRFADMMLAWLQSHAAEAVKVPGESRDANAIERIEAGRFALRAVFPLLANHATAQTHAFIKAYIDQVTAKHTSLVLPVQPNPRPFVPPSGSSSLGIKLHVLANFDLNWVQMVVALVRETDAVTGASASAPGRKRCPDAYKKAWSDLVTMYQRESQPNHSEEHVLQTVPIIGSIVFGIEPPRAQSNMLSDMMASMFGGGGSGAAPANPKPQQIKSAGPPPSLTKPPAQSAQPTPTSAAAAQTHPDDLVDDEMD